MIANFLIILILSVFFYISYKGMKKEFTDSLKANLDRLNSKVDFFNRQITDISNSNNQMHTRLSKLESLISIPKGKVVKAEKNNE